jgi:hypothetical protein
MCVHLPHGKNIVKGTTQVSWHSLKLHICMFEISKVKHNSFNCNILFGYFSSIASLQVQSLTQIKNVLHVQSIQTSKMDSSLFI